jgi:hypothetical protein
VLGEVIVKIMTTQHSITGTVVCYAHPAVETGLSCNHCGQPICAKCAIRTPVGYRCPTCVRQQQDIFYTGSTFDYVLAVVVALPLSLIAATSFTLLIGGLGFFAWWISLVVAPVVSGFTAEAVRWAVRKRRSRHLARVVSGCLILATLPGLLLMLYWGDLYGLIAPGILLFVGVSTILARLR